MKRMMSLIVLIAIGLGFSGCAGKNFKWQNVKTVQVGDSKNKLINKMKGKPYKISTEQIDGENVTKYIYVHVNGLTGSTKSVSFILKNNKVIETPHVPNEFLE